MNRLSNGNSVEGEYRVNEAKDFAWTVRSEGEPAYDEDGAVIVVVGFVGDITNRELDRVELERETDRLTEFANDIAHNLKNPLNVTVGHTTMMKNAFSDHHLHGVADALDRTDEIIEETFAMASKVGPPKRSASSQIPTSISKVGTRSRRRTRRWRSTTRSRSKEIPTDSEPLLNNVFRNIIAHGGTRA